MTAVARFIRGNPCVGWGVYVLIEESAARARDRIIHASPLRFLASAASDSIITRNNMYIYICVCILIASLIHLLIRESEIVLLKRIPFRGNWRGGRKGVSQFKRFGIHS